MFYMHVFIFQKMMQQVENLCGRFIIFSFIYFLKNLLKKIARLIDDGVLFFYPYLHKG